MTQELVMVTNEDTQWLERYRGRMQAFNYTRSKKKDTCHV